MMRYMLVLEKNEKPLFTYYIGRSWITSETEQEMYSPREGYDDCDGGEFMFCHAEFEIAYDEKVLADAAKCFKTPEDFYTCKQDFYRAAEQIRQIVIGFSHNRNRGEDEALIYNMIEKIAPVIEKWQIPGLTFEGDGQLWG